MSGEEPDKYREYVISSLEKLKPIFAKAAIGDFSDNIELPDEDNEFTELYTGIQTMLEIIREQFSELDERAAHYSNILESTRDGVIVEENEQIAFVNRSFANIFGYDDTQKLVGMPVSDLLTPEDAVRMSDYGRKRFKGEPVPTHYDFKGVHKDGSILDLEAAVATWSLPGKDGIVTVVRDNTERRKSEEQIKNSLIEKEILLKEIHHRVKNNLQIVRSLLSLQLKYIKDKDAYEFIAESVNRITSISIIHELFYKYKNISTIEFKNFISRIIHHLFNVYGITGSRINAVVRAENINIGIDTAVPCGLIINELLTNSLKYAFEDNMTGNILIDMQISESNILTLVIKDDGKGLPENFDIYNSPSMGLQLVSTLAKQLDGYIDAEINKGTKFTIRFPIPKGQK